MTVDVLARSAPPPTCLSYLCQQARGYPFLRPVAITSTGSGVDGWFAGAGISGSWAFRRSQLRLSLAMLHSGRAFGRLGLFRDKLSHKRQPIHEKTAPAVIALGACLAWFVPTAQPPRIPSA